MLRLLVIIMADLLGHLLLAAFATAALSVTIAKSAIGSPLRRWAYHLGEMVGDMVSCYYCISHWIAFAFVLTGFAPYRATWFATIYDIVLWTFAIVGMAAILSGVIIILKRQQQD